MIASWANEVEKSIEAMATFPHPLVWDAHNQGPSAREFSVCKFRYEVQVEAQAGAFVQRGIVEEVDYVSSESIFQPAALVEIERAG